MRHRFIIANCVFGLCGLTSLAVAEPSSSERDKAHELMTAGRAQRTASDLPGALKSFGAANEIMHVPTTLFEVAATQSALGQLMAARDTLKDLARLPSEPDEPEAFTKARHAGYELLTSIEQRIPTVDVSIVGDMGSHASSLSIDGHASQEGREFTRVQLDPGKHRLVAVCGSLKREEDVTVVESEHRGVDLVLEPTPLEAPLPAPAHARAAASSGDSPWLLYTLGGLGVAGLGAGLGFLAEAKHVKSSLETSCAPVCTSAQADRVHHWSTASNVAFGVGSAAVVAAVVVVIVESSRSEAPPKSDSHALALQVLPSAQGATFAAAGQF